MAIYQIPLKKLKNIANPFEQHSVITEGKPMDKKLVQDMIERAHVFEDDEDSDYIKCHRQAAFEYLNPTPNHFIQIDLEKNDNGWIVTQGLKYLVVAFLKNLEHVDIDIVGDEKKIKALFGKNVQLSEKKYEPEEHVDFKFNWEVNEISLKHSWENNDFILSQIKQAHYAKKEKSQVNPVLQFIPEYKWEEEEFLNKVIPELTYQDFNSLSDSVKTSFKIADLCQDVHIFKKMWSSVYSELFKEKKIYDEAELSSQEKELKSYLLNTVFTSFELCKKIISYSSYSTEAQESYRFFSREVQTHPEIVNLMIDKMRKNKNEYGAFSTLVEDLPEELFKDINVVYEVIKDQSLSSLRLNPQKTHGGEKEHSKIYKFWIDDKEKILQLNGMFYTTNFMTPFFNYMPTALKEDKDFILEMLKRNPGIYPLLKSKEKNNLEIFSSYIEHVEKIGEVPSKLLFRIKEPELIKKIIHDQPSCLSSPDCPQEWLENNDYLLSLPTDAYKEYFQTVPKKIISKVLSDPDNCVHIFKKKENNHYSEIYNKLSNTIKLNHEVTLSYISSSQYKEQTLNTIPKQLWGNKEFCLKALETTKFATRHIPKQFFNQEDFILGFCKILDSDSNDVQDMLTMVPKEIKKFLDTVKIDGSIHDYMKSYMFNSRLQKEIPKEGEKPVKKNKI